MSYQMMAPRRRHAGLGQTPPTSSLIGPAAGAAGVPARSFSVTLPPWETGTYERGIAHQSNEFGKVGDESVLNGILQRLADLKVISPTDKDADSGQFTARRHLRDWMNNVQYEVREDGPFVRALRALWIRQGRNPSMWPADIDFGPSTNSSKDLHIAKNFYSLIADRTPPMWVTGGDGFVHLSNDDMLWNTYVRQALERMGYLQPNSEINTKDDGSMVQALKAFYDEAVAAGGSTVGLDYGAWPSGINFGPNTNGNEVRIDSKLLTSVLNGWSARLVDAQKKASSQLAGATIRRPLIGVPSQLGGTQSRFVLSPSAVQAVLNSPAIQTLRTTLKF